MLSTSESHFGRDSNVDSLSVINDNTENIRNFAADGSSESCRSFFQPSLRPSFKYEHQHLRSALLSDCHLLDLETRNFTNSVFNETSRSSRSNCVPVPNFGSPITTSVLIAPNSAPAGVSRTSSTSRLFSPNSMTGVNLSSSSDSSNDDSLSNMECINESKQTATLLRLPAKKRKIIWNHSDDVHIVANRRDAKLSLPSGLHFSESESCLSSPLIVDGSPNKKSPLHYSPAESKPTRKRSLPAYFPPISTDIFTPSTVLVNRNCSEDHPLPQPRLQRRILVNDSTLLLNQLRAPTSSNDQLSYRETKTATLKPAGNSTKCSAHTKQPTTAMNIPNGYASSDNQQHKSLDPRRRFSLAAENRPCQLIQESNQHHRRFSAIQRPSMSPIGRSHRPSLTSFSSLTTVPSSVRDQVVVISNSSSTGCSSPHTDLPASKPLVAPENDTLNQGSSEFNTHLEQNSLFFKKSSDKSSQFDIEDDNMPSLTSHESNLGTSDSHESCAVSSVFDNIVTGVVNNISCPRFSNLNISTTQSGKKVLPLRDLVCCTDLKSQNVSNQLSEMDSAKLDEASRDMSLANAALIYGTNGFPLVLFSAPTSASAAAFAAATALASGTSPASLIPVPVEIASFRVSKSDKLHVIHDCDRSPGCNICRLEETEFSPLSLISTSPLCDGGASVANQAGIDYIPQLIFPIISPSSHGSGEPSKNCSIGLPWLVPRNRQFIKTSENSD